MKSSKKVMSAILAFAGALSVAATDNSITKPDARYQHIVSPAGPMTVEQVQNAIKNQPSVMSSQIKAVATAASSSTYTYLRCYYRTSTDLTSPTTNYVWGVNPSSGGYYTITGSWYGAGIIGNMFYSNTTQATLKSVCQSTLAGKGINQPVAMYFAADNSLSYNYTVWTNDSSNQGSTINKIVAFGDSLSDNQNMYNESDWIIPNSSSYYIGHFSNGYTWVEYLASDLNLPMYDWAVGGAGVTTQDLVIPGVIAQVQSWQQYMTQAPNYNPKNTLFTMLIGGNDLVNYGSTVAQVMSGETTALQNLINAGATNILVMELPDVSKAPVFKIDTNGTTIQAEVVDLRNQLSALVSSLRTQYAGKVNIQLFDTYTLFNSVLSNPSAYGVTNTTDSCLNINTDSSLNYAESHSPRAGCTASTVNGYMFWDILHPTTHTHQVLGNAVATFVQANFGNMATTSVAKAK